MEIKISKTGKEYQQALNKVDMLFDMQPIKNTAYGNELEHLLILIKSYEDIHFLNTKKHLG